MESRRWAGGAAGCGSVAAVLLAAALAGAQEPEAKPLPVTGQEVPASPVPGPEGFADAPLPGCRLSLDCLARLSWPALEALYRQAEPGAIPEGYTPGRAIYCPDSRFAGVRSKVTAALWHGKLFDPCDGTLVNQWLGFRAIKARVCYGPSWLDGRPSIIMDYSETSRVWADVRDELREVAPGLYLGRMYRRKACGAQFQFYFALEACPPAHTCR
jgi:hypothetical protein